MISRKKIDNDNWLDRLSNVNFTEKDNSFRMIGKLLKSVRSQDRKYQKSSVVDSFFHEKLHFTDEEVQAAINRLKKQNKYESISPAGFKKYQNINGDEEHESNSFPPWYEILNAVEPANFDNYSYNTFSPYIGIDEPLWVSFIKAIFGIVFPTFCDDRHSMRHEIHYLLSDYEYETRELILAELHVRRVIKALKNEFSTAFKFLNLISIQTHIKEILYEYFDIVFSLKKEVVLKTRFIIDFFTSLFYLNNNEKKYYRNIPITCRT